MAKFPPEVLRSMRNFWLRMDVDDLENAYQAALKGLVHRETEIEGMVRSQLGLGPDEEWPDRDDDDPDDPIARAYDEAGELSAQAERGAPMVRKAFVIALFHTWERHCNARLAREHYKHDLTTEKILAPDGHAAVANVVHELQLTANCAKHGPGTSCRDLYQLRPEFFPRVKSPEKASEKTLLVPADALSRYFSAIRSAAR